jgi:hypothetical protein
MLGCPAWQTHDDRQMQVRCETNSRLQVSEAQSARSPAGVRWALGGKSSVCSVFWPASFTMVWRESRCRVSRRMAHNLATLQCSQVHYRRVIVRSIYPDVCGTWP